MRLMRSILAGLLLIVAGFSSTRSSAAENTPPTGFPGVSGALESFHRAEIELQIRVQQQGHLGAVMRVISDLGVGKYNWILIVLLFFFVNPRLAARFALYYMIGLWLRELLALALQSPRPYWVDPRVIRLSAADGPASYGLPSGHAMMGSAFWFFAAAEIKKPWAWIL